MVILGLLGEKWKKGDRSCFKVEERSHPLTLTTEEVDQIFPNLAKKVSFSEYHTKAISTLVLEGLP